MKEYDLLIQEIEDYLRYPNAVRAANFLRTRNNREYEDGAQYLSAMDEAVKALGNFTRLGEIIPGIFLSKEIYSTIGREAISLTASYDGIQQLLGNDTDDSEIKSIQLSTSPRRENRNMVQLEIFRHPNTAIDGYSKPCETTYVFEGSRVVKSTFTFGPGIRRMTPTYSDINLEDTDLFVRIFTNIRDKFSLPWNAIKI